MGASRICARDGCGKAADSYSVFRIPARGHSMDSALELVIGLALCRRDARDIDVATFVSPELTGKVKISMMRMGLAQPDFSRLAVDVGVLGDQRWTDFHARKGTQA
jgi:hypothetical protein